MIEMPASRLHPGPVPNALNICSAIQRQSTSIPAAEDERTGKQREDEAEERPQEGRRSNCASGIGERVDEVELDIQERQHYTQAKERAPDDRHDEVDGRPRSPSVPAEHASAKLLVQR